MARAFPSVVIDNVQPLIDCGRSPIKRVVGEDLVVEADVFKDGHDIVAAVLKWRVVGKRAWRAQRRVGLVKATCPAGTALLSSSCGSRFR